MNEVAKTIVTAGVAGVFALGGSIAGGYWVYASKERELAIRMVEIGLSILKGDNEDAKGVPARTFAIAALRAYSGVKLEEKVWDEWLDRGSVPFTSVGDYWGTYLKWRSFNPDQPLFVPDLETPEIAPEKPFAAP